MKKVESWTKFKEGDGTSLNGHGSSHESVMVQRSLNKMSFERLSSKLLRKRWLIILKLHNCKPVSMIMKWIDFPLRNVTCGLVVIRFYKFWNSYWTVPWPSLIVSFFLRIHAGIPSSPLLSLAGWDELWRVGPSFSTTKLPDFHSKK
jgi:hypothetical protein